MHAAAEATSACTPRLPSYGRSCLVQAQFRAAFRGETLPAGETAQPSVRFGGVYDQNPQPTNVVSPLLPDSDRIGGAFGVGWRNAGWHIDATEFALHFKNRSTQGQSLEGFNGSYKTNANLVTVDFGYRF